MPDADYQKEKARKESEAAEREKRKPSDSWGPRYMVEVGFSENWVLDKATDTAKDIRIRYPGEAAPAAHRFNQSYSQTGRR